MKTAMKNVISIFETVDVLALNTITGGAGERISAQEAGSRRLLEQLGPDYEQVPADPSANSVQNDGARRLRQQYPGQRFAPVGGIRRR